MSLDLTRVLLGEEMRGKQSFVAAVSDLSNQKRLEQNVREAPRVEAIAILASGVAHDLNNRLMGVSGCADITLSTLDPVGPARTYIEEIKRSAATGAAISRQLLGLGAKCEREVSVFDLDAPILQNRTILARGRSAITWPCAFQTPEVSQSIDSR